MSCRDANGSLRSHCVPLAFPNPVSLAAYKNKKRPHGRFFKFRPA